MPIQDTDYLLIQTPNGVSSKIQASTLRDGLDSTYADHYLLINNSSGSHKILGSNVRSRAADGGSYDFLLERSGTSYRVGESLFSDYFTQSSINYTGYAEYKVGSGTNTSVSMPASAATADVIIACVYVDVPSITNTWQGRNGFTSLLQGPTNQRPICEVYIKYGSASGNTNIAVTDAAVKNVTVATFELDGQFSLIYSEINSTTTSTNWTGIRPTTAQIESVSEYYGMFSVSPRPQQATYTGAAPTTASSVTITELTPKTTSNAKTWLTQKLSAADGRPLQYNLSPFQFSNRGCGFAFFFGAV